MEILTSTYSIFSVALCVGLLASLLLVNVITSQERRLITGVAMVAAGLFFVARAEQPLVAVVGGTFWLIGLGIFLGVGLSWSGRRTSPAGSMAALLLLPSALIGAFLLGGMVISMLAGPARLLARVTG